MSQRPPRLEACYSGENPVWHRMAQVLEHTARRHCPDWDVNVRKVVPAPRGASPLGIRSHVDNTQKMDEWHRIISASSSGDRVLLIDSDTFVCRPLTDIWERDFDIAYTVKRKVDKFPFNSGVVFVRVTAASRRFVDAWQQENVRLLETPQEHQRWRAKYGGVNQAALGAMLTNGIVHELGLRVLEVPCSEWNCEDSSWKLFHPEQTRIVHVKAVLRRAACGHILSGQAPRAVVASAPEVRRLAEMWRTLDREVRGEVLPVAPPARPRPAGPRVMRKLVLFRTGWTRV